MISDVKKINITASFKEIKEPIPGLEGLETGEYLVLELDSLEPVYINRNEFDLELKKNLREDVSGNKDISAIHTGYSGSIPSLDLNDDNKNHVVNFLQEKLSLKVDSSSEYELSLFSDDNLFLELPWEELTNKNIYVFRNIIIDNSSYLEKMNGHNIGVFVSHSNKVGTKKMGSLKNKIKQELLEINNLFIVDESPLKFMVDSLKTYYHVSREAIQSVDFDNFDLLHFIWHGEKEGVLLTHKESDDYNEGEMIDNNIIFEELKKSNFYLIFLSYCFSLDSGVPFRAIKEGVSKHVIAYKGEVGEDSAKDFSKYFYGELVNGIYDQTNNCDKMKDIYKNSLFRYYKEGKNRKYIPILYSQVNI